LLPMRKGERGVAVDASLSTRLGLRVGRAYTAFNPSEGCRRWEQVFNPGSDTANALSIREHFPDIKMVHWFDRIKPEGTAGNDVIDWRGPSGQAPVREALAHYLKDSGYWQELPEFNGGRACSSSELEDDVGDNLAND
jgi:hypothetical protein